MWNLFFSIIIAAELAMLSWFLVEKIRRGKFSATFLFIGLVFTLNWINNCTASLYDMYVMKESGNLLINIASKIKASAGMFVGDVDKNALTNIINDYPLFLVTYFLGWILGLISTINTVIEAIEHTVRNNYRVTKRMRNKECDIVIGNSAKAVKYARSSDAVILLDAGVIKETVNILIEDGFPVVHKSFTTKLLGSRIFCKSTRYNIICPCEENTLEYINTVISFVKSSAEHLDIHLFVEIEGDKAETVRREIIDSNKMESLIDIFSIDDLLARNFTEKNPVIKYLPEDFIVDGALKPESDIAVFIIGYGGLGRQIFKNSVLNNQYVTYSDGYKVLPLHYYICDTAIDSSDWLIDGMKQSLDELVQYTDKYFTPPEMPYTAEVISVSPTSREIMKAIKGHINKPNSYAFVIVDTNDDYSNIEIAAKIKSFLYGINNFRIFVCSKDSSAKNENVISYFGKRESVLTHDIIVNDCFSSMGKKLNEMYEVHYASDDEKKRTDFADYIHKKANVSWAGLDYFTKYSNIYSAMSLRVKLNLLGLDYKSGDETPCGTELLPDYSKELPYSDYLTRSTRNALIAQEHARWNAYHLVNEWMPLEKEGIVGNMKDNGSVKFTVKIPAAKKHACLTTHADLNILSTHLARSANNNSSAADYDFYRNDEFLLAGIDEIFNTFGYSAVKK